MPVFTPLPGTCEDLRHLIADLGVRHGDTIFVHTSFSRLSGMASTPDALLDLLQEILGSDGTLAMPRYIWNVDRSARPWKGYSDFLDLRPTFDIRSAPSNIGVVPETFRRRQGVVCSLSYFWPISVVGRRAIDVTSGQEEIEDPYGPGSAFERLRSLGVKVLGLGVSLNTTSVAPLVDAELSERHPHEVFTPHPIPCPMIDFAGRALRLRSRTLLPEIVKGIKPGIVAGQILGRYDDCRFIDRSGTYFFCYPYERFHSTALEMASSVGCRESGLPWLPGCPVRFVARLGTGA